MPTAILTPQFVKASSCPTNKNKLDLFDSHCKGLMLEVRRSGGKTFYLRYQDARGKTRQLKLADARDLSLAQVRKLANARRAEIALGEDPAEQKKILKSVPTVAAFVSTSYLPYVKGYKRSWKTDESLLRNHVLPLWGARYMDEITKQDVVDLLTRHRTNHAPGSCNRLLILLRYKFNLALRWESCGLQKNPTSGFPLLEENNKKERYLSVEETSTLYEVLADSVNPMLLFIIAMLILTGARKREVLDSCWEDFDLERKSWRIAMSKLGKARHVPLSDGAIQILRAVPRHVGCPWVFPNPKTKKPYVSFFYAWNTARRLAGLADVRIHDLRHSFASFAVNARRSLYEVQKILGHTQIKTTQRYSHLTQDSLLAAANDVSQLVPVKGLPTHAFPS